MTAQRPLFDPDKMARHEDPAAVPRSLSVTQLNAMIKRVLGMHLPETIHLVGQISNCSRPQSGHLYLTLKDEQSEIRAVMWRSAVSGLKFKPTDGMEVIATGFVDVYPPRGQYQFQIRKLEPKGVGALELAFRQLYEKLKAEGLFEPGRKRAIPRYPRRIGIVTSNTGAAIHDILQTIRRRYHCVELLLFPVRVQGEGAAREIAAAIEQINRHATAIGGIDVMIVGRGGGSLEDLWAFNEESVARAIAASTIPIISGVGHEVDTTIADLVADRRAHTPTAAAELAVPVLSDLLDGLSRCESRLRQCIGHRLDLARSQMESLCRSEWLRDPMAVVHRAEQRFDETIARMQWALRQNLNDRHRCLHRAEMRLSAVQPAVIMRNQQTRLNDAGHALSMAMRHRLRLIERRLDCAIWNLTSASPVRRLPMAKQRLDRQVIDLDRAMQRRLQAASQRVDHLAATLEALSYRRTLARGFSITRTVRGKQIVTDPAEVRPNQQVITETAGGSFRSKVIPDHSEPPSDDAGKKR